MANEAAAHADHVEPNYFAIMVILTILTILELMVPPLVSAKLTAGSLLVILAVAKALLVALYFMHLRFERTTLSVIALTPMVICVFLIIMLLPDLTSTTRTYTPVEPTAMSETADH